MDHFAKGTVKFETLLVMGRDFIPPVWATDTGFYDYAFSVESFMTHSDKKKAKKDAVPTFDYYWSGHFNACIGSARIHLHNQEHDVCLMAMERKLVLAKETLDFFIKEHKARMKAPGKKDLVARHWLNDPTTKHTGYTAYELRKDGGGYFALADCHKTLHWFIDVYANDKGKLVRDPYAEKTLIQLDILSKGLGKAIRAVEEIRKFFERELDAPPPTPVVEAKPAKAKK